MSLSRQLSAHPSFCHLDDIDNLCRPLKAFEITSFANARVNHKNEFSTLCNRPDYMTHYLEQAYHQADISAKLNPFEMGHYVMWDVLECQGKTAEMLHAASLHDYKHIFTIMKQRAQHTDYYHFGTHRHQPSMNQWYLNNLDKLNAFIEYFDDRLQSASLLLKGHEICFPIESSNCELDAPCEVVSSQEFLQSISPIRLSHKQWECFRLLIGGLTAKEIAQQLFISHRTVEDYLAIVKSKFQVRNKAELIAKGLRVFSKG